MHDEHTTTIATVEQQLVDVVVTHNLERVDVPLTAFADWTCSRFWTAITNIWDRGAQPTVPAVVDELDRLNLATSACTAADLMFVVRTWPLQGYLHAVDDYIAVLLGVDRRQRLAILLGDASQAVADGADPDAVLNRIIQQAAS